MSNKYKTNLNLNENKDIQHPSDGNCKECGDKLGRKGWCKSCNSHRLGQGFNKWTSGNDDIDQFIQSIQISAENCMEVVSGYHLNSLQIWKKLERVVLVPCT